MTIITPRQAKNVRSIITPIARLGFPYLFQKDTGRQYSDSRYKCNLELPAEDDFWPVLSALVHKLCSLEFPDVSPAELDDPIKPCKGDATMHYITAKSLKQPALVDSKVKPVTREVPLGGGRGRGGISSWFLTALDRAEGRLLGVR